jgi:hypothetical protein
MLEPRGKFRASTRRKVGAFDRSHPMLQGRAMSMAPSFASGPLRRHANYVILLFVCVQVGLVLRATLPLPGKLHGHWPWRMFEKRGPWERALRATGIDANGQRVELPLHRIFGYARGTTHLFTYQQVEALSDANGAAGQAAFAAYLARRASEFGLHVSAVELKWIAQSLDDGHVEEHPIGTFTVGALP